MQPYRCSVPWHHALFHCSCCCSVRVSCCFPPVFLVCVRARVTWLLPGSVVKYTVCTCNITGYTYRTYPCTCAYSCIHTCTLTSVLQILSFKNPNGEWKIPQYFAEGYFNSLFKKSWVQSEIVYTCTRNTYALYMYCTCTYFSQVTSDSIFLSSSRNLPNMQSSSRTMLRNRGFPVDGASTIVCSWCGDNSLPRKPRASW